VRRCGFNGDGIHALKACGGVGWLPLGQLPFSSPLRFPSGTIDANNHPAHVVFNGTHRAVRRRRARFTPFAKGPARYCRRFY
jgi:hypothetical protein